MQTHVLCCHGLRAPRAMRRDLEKLKDANVPPPPKSLLDILHKPTFI